jgi:mRNA interferase MazF
MAQEHRRGQIWMADLDPVVGHDQAGRRPVLIVQNDVGNRFSPTVIVAAITSSLPPHPYPTEVRLRAGDAGLRRDSSVRLDQIRTVDKARLTRLLGALGPTAMQQVDRALEISLGLISF